jgi:penicillin-binding protein 2
MAGQSSTNTYHKPARLGIFRAVVLISFILLAARIYQIQFTQRETYVFRADDNRFDEVSIPATRGIILDRNGLPLAVNVASANVTVTPALLPSDEAEEMEVLARLASMLNIPLSGELDTVDERGIPERSLLTMVEEGEGIAPYQPVVVETDIEHDVARIIVAEKASMPGVDVEWVSVREYPSGALTAHVIGYMGPIPERLAEEYEAAGYVLDRDRIGYDGVEFSLEKWLAGNPGLQIVERDVAGQIVRTIGETRPSQPGYSVRLTLDLDLQRAAQQYLVETLENLREAYPDNPIGYDRGVVIAMNPRTGEILAMVSWPTYDNSRFARAIDYPYYLQVSQDPKQPLFNQAISSLYPPGSIFKVITLSGVLEEGIVTPEYIIEDPGEIQLENRYYPNEPSKVQTFVCWLDEGHGEVNAVQAIAWSCDVYFYKVGGGYKDEVPGVGLGIEGLDRWMGFYGLGDYTSVELAGEIDGVIPDPAWKRRTWGENWSTGDTYNSAFGQGYVLSTPLQMINAMNAIANDGVQMRPTLVREVIDADGNVVKGFESEVLREIPISLENLRVIQDGMRAAVTIEGGTAVHVQEEILSYVPIAGKTGTAEFCDNIAAALEQCIPGAWPAHAWFMGYAPYGSPEIAVIAFIYNGDEGSVVAAPLASQVMDAYFKLKTERALQKQLEQEGAGTPAP